MYELKVIENENNNDKLDKLIKYLKSKKIDTGEYYEESKWAGDYKFYFIILEIKIDENDKNYDTLMKYIKKMKFE